MKLKKAFTIVVDSREQLPYAFNSPGVTTIRRALAEGDYSLDGFEKVVVVERKSLEDYATSLCGDRERFLREIERMQAIPHRLIVVEGSIDDILGWRYRSGIHPNSIIGGTIALFVDKGTPVVFCGDRQIACRFTEGYLKRVYQKIIHESDEEIRETNDQ